MRQKSTHWRAVLAIGLWIFTVPALVQGESHGTTLQPAGQDRGETGEDRALLARIRQGLQENAPLSGAAQKIHITVENGTVTLHGEVKDAEEKEGLGTQVGRVHGVREVKNHLQASGAKGESSEGKKSN